ncbi:hypothetical protein [Allorhodopirellula heiligendammensis]|uniref:Lipoprotein n=1 Tax=Allorhodopirellula heiligendammensis TaxID=2714739 RepID=A0A5C6C1G3_9BACT|nr:hypothetical protein [Allorhodopirellula heiligendammensis]TWU18008.1 hypothetical protein Poly21_01610 [Allorhodopirellula heiligendammensis]
MRPILLALALLFLPASLGCDSKPDPRITDMDEASEEAVFLRGFRDGKAGYHSRYETVPSEYWESYVAGRLAANEQDIAWQTDSDTAWHWGEAVEVIRGFYAGQAGYVIGYSDGMYIVDLANYVHTPKKDGWPNYAQHKAPTLCGVMADELKAYVQEGAE